MDMMMKTMGKLMERLTMENRPPPIENQEQQNRNQNFRRPLPPPRNQRIPKVPLQFELKEESDFDLMVEEGPLCIFQTQI